MKEILDKLTSYNLFNYLLPGVVFVVLAEKLTRYSFIQKDLVVGAFLYYFIGLVVSRLGSLLLEPLLKWTSFVRFSDYKDFVAASKADPKIEILSESNNSYRTLCMVFLGLLLLKAYEKLEVRASFLSNRGALIAVVLLFLMFLFSYKKQTSYITKRVKAAQTERSKAVSV